MRICAIQNQIQPKAVTKKVAKRNEIMPKPQEQTVAPTFGGNGSGVVWGLGTGLIAGLCATTAVALSGGLALPLVVGEACVVASGLGGAYAGDKIEDKINKFLHGDDKDKKE